MAETLLSLAVGVLPVLAFLAALVGFESYKLVRLGTVVAMVAAGRRGRRSLLCRQWLADRVAGRRTHDLLAATPRRWSRSSPRASSSPG